MTLFWIIVAVLVALTWLPAGAIATMLWSDFVKRSLGGWRDMLPRPYVLGWLYVAVLLTAVMFALVLFVIGVFAAMAESIWVFVKGGAPEYWRYIVENAEDADADKN